MWEANRLVILYFRRKYPSLNETKQRLTAIFIVCMLVSLVIRTLNIWFYDETEFWGYKFPLEGYLHSIFVALLFVIIVAGIYEAIYYFVKWKDVAVEAEALKKENLQTQLDSLKTQINPHFLFNALNTLYGTALQENAERTGEGIQKLGDMMRFTLHENMQDKILLVREVEYLRNYIDLQTLRIVNTPGIQILVRIEEPAAALLITPMLLIPFIENAFKHGVSLREPSYISIALHTQNNILYFDVQNSIHLKPDGDPEKFKSGIGLPNVKERLQLEYPERHELVIRQTAKDFFVHLTINL